MRYGRGKSTDSTIPTSSMADIAFLLIIFFMVTSVFAVTKGLELSLPDDDAPDETEPQDAVFIHVQEDRVFMDCREMEVREIRAYLEPILNRNPNKPVILYTEWEAEYRKMVEVYDALTETDGAVRNIFIPTRSDIDQYVTTFGENPLQVACR